MATLWPPSIDTSDKDFTQKVISDLRTRVKTLAELAGAADFYFAGQIQYDTEAAGKFLTPEILPHLKELAGRISSVEDFGKEGLEAFLKAFIEEKAIKFKAIAQPLRLALTGKTVSPGIDEVMATLGKKRVARRLEDAVKFIEERG